MAWLRKTTRTNKKSGRSETYWSISWRDTDGKDRTRAVGFCPAAEARKALKVFEGKLAAGEAAEPEARTRSGRSSSASSATPKLAEYLDHVYVPRVREERAASTAELAYWSARALSKLLGELPLDEITFAAADAYVSARRKEGRRSRTIMIELRTLRCALEHACDCGLLRAVPKLPTLRDHDRKPHRFLTAEESVAVLDALRPLDEQPHEVTRGRPPVVRDRLTYLAVLMALNTGARKGEIFSRGWEDVRWGQGPHGALIIGAKPEIRFQVKTRRERAVPLSPELAEELRALHRDLGEPRAGWLFPSPRDASKPRTHFGKALERACKRAGIPKIHPHGLRHTWASRLAMAGVDRRTLMELGGWTEGRMLDEIYAHTTDDHKAEVMARTGLGSSASEPPSKAW